MCSLRHLPPGPLPLQPTAWECLKQPRCPTPQHGVVSGCACELQERTYHGMDIPLAPFLLVQLQTLGCSGDATTQTLTSCQLPPTILAAPSASPLPSPPTRPPWQRRQPRPPAPRWQAMLLAAGRRRQQRLLVLRPRDPRCSSQLLCSRRSGRSGGNPLLSELHLLPQRPDWAAKRSMLSLHPVYTCMPPGAAYQTNPAA